MKKFSFFSKIIVFALIIAINLEVLPLSRAENLEPLELVLITIDPHKDTADIVWKTNYPTRGAINFGPTPEFGSRIENVEYSENHEMPLSGLQQDTTYYLSIDAYDLNNRQLPLSTWAFITSKGEDNTLPILTNVHTAIVSGNTAQFVWSTNELATSCVYYGKIMSNLDKNSCNNQLVLTHDLVINGLERNQLYYYRAYSKDDSDNGAFSVYYNFRTNFVDDVDLPPLEIYQTYYASRMDDEGITSVNIYFQTNHPVSGKLKWGVRAQAKYDNTIELPAPRSSVHNIHISRLAPTTDYIYVFELKDIFGQTISSQEYIFTTVGDSGSEQDPLDDKALDYDQDGLTNGEETDNYGTSPIKSDTDGDGYLDGVEVVNCYDPLGPGKMSICPDPTAGQMMFAYHKPRVSSYQIEVNAANEIRHELEAMFKGPFKVSQSGWYVLVNAYVYGGYPLGSLYKAIVHGGKTVHPDIPFSAWQNSPDYLEHINK